MSKKIWSIPVIAIYLYVVTILTQSGFYSYFGIPSNFVEASVVSNTVYFWVILKVLVTLATSWGWWWLLIISAIIIIVKIFGRYTLSAIAVIMAILAYNSFDFGISQASSMQSFYMISTGCQGLDQGQRYIIPVMHEDIGVLIPIDINNKIDDGFIVKNLSGLDCKIQYKYVGLIKK
ncbi:MAG: hypothetical protein WCQ00_03000 [bacterium]